MVSDTFGFSVLSISKGVLKLCVAKIPKNSRGFAPNPANAGYALARWGLRPQTRTHGASLIVSNEMHIHENILNISEWIQKFWVLCWPLIYIADIGCSSKILLWGDYIFHRSIFFRKPLLRVWILAIRDPVIDHQTYSSIEENDIVLTTDHSSMPQAQITKVSTIIIVATFEQSRSSETILVHCASRATKSGFSKQYSADTPNSVKRSTGRAI